MYIIYEGDFECIYSYINIFEIKSTKKKCLYLDKCRCDYLKNLAVVITVFPHESEPITYQPYLKSWAHQV